MNYLAHALLSGDEPELLVGNMCGDSLVGGMPSEIPEGVRRGLLLHFDIDRVTDSSDEFRTCMNAFRPAFGRFSHIIVDLSFDYVLAGHWDRYCDVPFDAFVDWTYETLDANRERFVGDFQRRFDRMREYDWLRGYQHISGIERALRRVAMRLKRTRPNTHRIAEAIQYNEDVLNESFASLFPKLQSRACNSLQQAD